MKLIKVGRSGYAKVDDDLYELLAAYKWYYEKGYARTTIRGHKVRMHRLIMGVTRVYIVVDHINGDKLDNQRKNLRCCTRGDNNCNVGPRSKACRFKGVTYYSHIRKWVARVRKNGRTHYCGVYVSEVAAALAYDRKALELHGAFAYQNFGDASVRKRYGAAG